jgi:hypothetical protein
MLTVAVLCSLSVVACIRPITPQAAQTAAPKLSSAVDKIANALSAGPAPITAKADVMDWPAKAGGDLVELRAGTNDWTCLPDDPTTPTNDPMCLDKPWMVWLKAYLNGTKPDITTVGIAYMLQGGSVADNDDPTTRNRRRARIGRSIRPTL